MRASGDKKTPAGVIMITAVQRKTEYCGRTRMAAVGSWEIGILERHFRVAGSCRCQLATADHQQRCFPIVGPLAFRPAPLLLSARSRYLFPAPYEFAHDLIAILIRERIPRIRDTDNHEQSSLRGRSQQISLKVSIKHL